MSPAVPPFEEAWDELVTIRAALEQGRVRVGGLAATVTRAAELTAVCRGHLRAAEMAVEELASAPPRQQGPQVAVGGQPACLDGGRQGQ